MKAKNIYMKENAKHYNLNQLIVIAHLFVVIVIKIVIHARTQVAIVWAVSLINIFIKIPALITSVKVYIVIVLMTVNHVILLSVGHANLLKATVLDVL